MLEPQYVEFFRSLKSGPKPKPGIPPGRAKSVVLVPYLNVIEPECEDSLRKLEAEGVRIVRSGGNSAIDVARNRLASEALHDGAESILFVDSDIGFDPIDALRLLARPEPVVSGVYAKKGNRKFASTGRPTAPSPGRLRRPCPRPLSAEVRGDRLPPDARRRSSGE